MTLMQRGNKVTVRSDGTRSSRPFTDEEVSSMTAPKAKRTAAMGSNNAANKAALKEAGMKKGGSVRGYGMARKPMKKGGVCR